MTETVADLIIDYMVKAGIRRIYGIPGDSINPLVEAVRKRNDLKYVQTRHEEGAAFAASFDSKFNGGLSACFGTSGPGSIHLLNGLYDAKMDHSSVIAITGQIPLSLIGRDYHQEVNMIKLFDDVSVYNKMLMEPSNAPHIVSRALIEARLHGGVSHLSVPVDVLAMPLDMKQAVNLFPPSVSYSPDLQEIAELVNESSKPLIFVGKGVREDAYMLGTLSDKIGAPIVYALGGKGILPDNDPRVMGGLGLLGSRASVNAIRKSDLIIMVGTSFPYFRFIPEGKRIVQVDLDPVAAGKQLQVTRSIVAGSDYFLGRITGMVTEKKDKFYLALKNNKKAWLRELRREESESNEKINPKLLTRVLSESADEDSVIVCDTGNTTVWVARHFRSSDRNRFMFSGSLASMGAAIPGSIGISMSGKKQVIATVGDGGIVMTIMELATIIKYKIPLKILVYNNSKLGMIKFEQEVAGYPDWGTDLMNPDFSDLAGTFGIKSSRIERNSEIKKGIENMLSSKGPYLLEAMTDPLAKPMPPTITAKQVEGYMVATIREHVRYLPEGE